MKKALSLLLALCLLLSLGGCHGSRASESFTIPDSLDTDRQFEITFWAKNDTNKTQTMIYEQAIADFQALYPNITVTLRLYTDYTRIYNDVITNMVTDTTPNVCITYPDHIATYLTAEDAVVPLDGLMAHEKYGLAGSELRYDSPSREELIPEFLAEGKLAGQQYALPFMRSTEACYINKTYVEALGYTVPDVLTWDFIWEVSEAALARDAEGNYLVNGQSVMIPFIDKSTDNMMIQMAEQLGSGYSTESGDILLFNDTTRELLYTIAEHAGTGAFSTFKISSYPANFLNAGQCIFAIDSTAGSTWMGTHAPLSDISADRLVEFETVVRPVPQFDTETPQMISQGPSVCLFNKEDPQEVLAAWLFAQYLLTDGVQMAYAETEGYVPVTASARENPDYQAYLSADDTDAAHYGVKLAATRLLLENTENTFTTPVFNGSASLRDAAGQLIENVTKSVRRKQTVDDAYMENLFADVRSLYRLDQLDGLANQGKAELGPLPGGSIALLVTLGGVWALLGAVSAVDRYRRRKSRHET